MLQLQSKHYYCTTRWAYATEKAGRIAWTLQCMDDQQAKAAEAEKVVGTSAPKISFGLCMSSQHLVAIQLVQESLGSIYLGFPQH